MRIGTVFRRLLGVIAMCVDDVGRKGEVLVLDVTPRWRRPRCTRRMEELVAYLAQQMSKTAVCKRAGIDWRTVGSIVERSIGEKLDPARRPDGRRRR
ncbi:MAG: transposase family protein [Casimicrobiaceae bacterium]